MNIQIFLKKLETDNFVEVLKELLPTRYQSEHDSNFLNIKKNNSTYFFFISFSLISLYFCRLLWKLIKQKRAKLAKRYKLLVYIPNKKYQRFYHNIFSEADQKFILIISDDKIDDKSITKNCFFDNKFTYLNKVLLPSYFFCLKVCYKKTIKIKDDKVDYSSILHLITSVNQSFFLAYFTKQTQFEKIVSLHPNGDLHYLLRMSFKNEFHSIRPDTTSYSEEHRYIKSDYLYYKSNFEKDVYLSYKLDCILVKSGYLYDKIFKPKDNFNETINILFIDTCTNINENSVEIRRKTINDFYEVFASKSKKINLYHKFHPGLLKTEKRLTIKLLENNRVVIVEDNLNFRKFDVVFGFYSTLYHDVLCNGISFIELSGEYNLYKNSKNPILFSPIDKINNKNDLYIKLNQIEVDIEAIYNPEIWKWYYETYNIPYGKIELNNKLLA